MSNIDKRALREAAEKALPAMKRLLMMPNDELFDEALLNVDGDVDAANAFNLLTGPETMLALLDELEAKDAELQEYRKAASHPVGLFAKRNGTWLELCQGDTFEHPDGVPLYTAPPVPVSVPELTALDNLAGEMLNHAMNCERRVAVAYTHCAHRLAEEVRDLRAAMLQGGKS